MSNPPTPTIEEQLDALLHKYMYAAKYVKRDDSMNGWTVIEEANKIRDKARADLSLLITKAVIDENERLYSILHPYDGDNEIMDILFNRIKSLKATTHIRSNDG